MIEETTPIPKEKKKKSKDRIKKDNDSYYQRHKEEIKAARNKRYMEDPEFKERLLRTTREANKRRAQERREMKKGQSFAAETPTTFRVQLPDGKEIVTEMFTTTQLAMFLERSPRAIRLWEEKGNFPKALYRALNNNRLYTTFQVSEIVRHYKIAMSQFGKRYVTNRISGTNFFKRVQALWAKYPYGVEEFEVDNGQDEQD